MFLLIVTGLSPATTIEWNQFLGPNRNGATSDDTFVKHWILKDIKEAWRVPVGEGYSGIVTSGDLLFTMESNGKEEFVVSHQISSGEPVWRFRTGTSPQDIYGGLGPRVTPSVNGDTLFTVSATGDLIALKTTSGKPVWKRSLQDFGWRPPAEGTASSPLVQDNRIFIMIGGTNDRAVGALDALSGKTIWTSENDRASYSSAVRWDLYGASQVLWLTGSNLFSVHADTGKLLWKYPWNTYDYVNVATPLVIPPDRVFISAGYDQGAAMLRIENRAGLLVAREVWRNREMKNHFNNSVYYDGTIYGFDNAVLKAMDADTGQTLWRESGMGKGSLIVAGKHLLILSETGELILAQPSREKFIPRKKFAALKGRCWTPPSLSSNRIFLRNQTEMVCLTTQ